MARKMVDINELAAAVAEKMAGKPRVYTMPPNTLTPSPVVADVDIQISLNKQAAQEWAAIMGDAYPKSIHLDGIDYTVMNPQDQMKDIMKTLDKEASLVNSLSKLGAEAKAKGHEHIATRIAILLEQIR